MWLDMGNAVSEMIDSGKIPCRSVLKSHILDVNYHPYLYGHETREG